MALVFYMISFCSGIINRRMKLCDRWNATVFVMADGKVIVLTVLRCYTELVGECGGCYTTLYQGVFISWKGGSPKFYGLPKIHKKETSLIFIVLSRGTVTYGVSRELCRILRWILYQCSQHIKIPRTLWDNSRTSGVKKGICIISYNVTALFTSVMLDPAINIIRNRLGQDAILKNRTTMSVRHIIILLKIFLKNAHFLFYRKFFEQVQGSARD